MNSSQAAMDPSIRKIAKGEAVLGPLSRNGHNTYKLYSYIITGTY